MGLDDFFAILDWEEYRIVEVVYILGMSYEEAGKEIGFSKVSIHKKLSKILNAT